MKKILAASAVAAGLVGSSLLGAGVASAEEAGTGSDPAPAPAAQVDRRGVAVSVNGKSWVQLGNALAVSGPSTSWQPNVAVAINGQAASRGDYGNWAFAVNGSTASIAKSANGTPQSLHNNVAVAVNGSTASVSAAQVQNGAPDAGRSTNNLAWAVNGSNASVSRGQSVLVYVRNGQNVGQQLKKCTRTVNVSGFTGGERKRVLC